jgi:hypothetical protein
LNGFEGIFFNLKKIGANLESVVHVSCSSTLHGNCSDLLEWDDSCWFSKDQQNSWILFEFKKISVKISGYAIKSDDRCYPKSWKLEGTTKSNEKYQIDEQRGRNELCSEYAAKSFSCETQQYFSKIQFTQTGKNSRGDDDFDLTLIELFGAIKFE